MENKEPSARSGVVAPRRSSRLSESTEVLPDNKWIWASSEYLHSREQQASLLNYWAKKARTKKKSKNRSKSRPRPVQLSPESSIPADLRFLQICFRYTLPNPNAQREHGIRDFRTPWPFDPQKLVHLFEHRDGIEVKQTEKTITITVTNRTSFIELMGVSSVERFR